jgi:hypothetical protein
VGHVEAGQEAGPAGAAAAVVAAHRLHQRVSVGRIEDLLGEQRIEHELLDHATAHQERLAHGVALGQRVESLFARGELRERSAVALAQPRGVPQRSRARVGREIEIGDREHQGSARETERGELMAGRLAAARQVRRPHLEAGRQLAEAEQAQRARVAPSLGARGRRRTLHGPPAPVPGMRARLAAPALDGALDRGGLLAHPVAAARVALDLAGRHQPRQRDAQRAPGQPEQGARLDQG